MSTPFQMSNEYEPQGDLMLYNKFLELCDEKGISPSTAAAEMGISKSLLSKWKNRKQVYPSTKVLEKMTNYFGVDAIELIGTDTYNESFDVVLGRRIKNLRKAAGLTQSELANILEIGVKRIGPLENGRATLTPQLLSKLSAHFNVPEDYFTNKPEKEDRQHEGAFRVESIGQMIRYKRQSMTITTHDLAVRIGATEEQIIRWEEGNFLASDKAAIDRLAEALHISRQIINRFFSSI